MSIQKQNPPQSHLSDEEMDELGGFLISDATSDETMMLDRLDGFLTALVSGPVMPAPGVWLPKVWGPSVSDEPTFESSAQLERITGLIMRHFNSIALRLQENPDACAPVFDSSVYPDSPREFIDGEMWAYGYMNGVDLQRANWQRFFDDTDRTELLRPIYLLGTEDVTPAEEALVESPEQREELSKLIPASIAELYRFWQPYRRVYAAPASGGEMPKVGRNEKCPCGSERKFKKCCGATPAPE